MKEKAQFIIDNKTLLMANINNIKYELFKILSRDEPIQNMIEYKIITKSLEKPLAVNHNDAREAVYIIYLLSHFLDKITMDQVEKEKCRDNLFKYVEYMPIENKKTLIKTRVNHSELSA